MQMYVSCPVCWLGRRLVGSCVQAEPRAPVISLEDGLLVVLDQIGGLSLE